MTGMSELNQEKHYIIISALMVLVALIFLLYVGSSMAYSAKRFLQQTHVIEMTCP